MNTIANYHAICRRNAVVLTVQATFNFIAIRPVFMQSFQPHQGKLHYER